MKELNANPASTGTNGSGENGLADSKACLISDDKPRVFAVDETLDPENKENSKTKYTVATESKVGMVQCKILLLDGTDCVIEVHKSSTGGVLLNKVCEKLNLLEKEYFALSFRELNDVKVWLQNEKPIAKQLKKLKWQFSFELKFYPQDPTVLREELTRYQIYLQIRVDILAGRLPCSFVTHSLLGSYACQSQLGDYDSDEHGPGIEYLKHMKFAPGQTEELLEKVAELHRTNRGITPSEAEWTYLDNAKNMSLYGVHQHKAIDKDNNEVMLGICAAGLLVFKERIRMNRFIWAKILKIAYKKNKFTIQVRPGQGEEPFVAVYKLPNYITAKRVWKLAVEHHAFFRLREPVQTPRGVFMRKGPRYFSGVTAFQAAKASENIQRESMNFPRVYYTVGRGDQARNKFDSANTPNSTVDRTEETIAVDFSTVTLDRTKRNKGSVPYADMDGNRSYSGDDMIPVRDADGTLVYMKKPTQSVSSTGDVFDTLPGQRRPSQDDLYRTGERNGGYDGQKVTMNVGPGESTGGFTYSKTPYPRGPGYLTPGGGPSFEYGGQGGPPGYSSTLGSQSGYPRSGTPTYGIDDMQRQHGGYPDDPDHMGGDYQNSSTWMGYRNGPGTPGSQQGLDDSMVQRDQYGNVVVTKNVIITTSQRTNQSFDGGDGFNTPFQEDHLQQQGLHLGLGGEGSWGGPYSTTTKTLTRTYTAPDGTVVTERRTEKNGVIETHIEKRKMNDDVEDDYDKMLADAIRSVTDMNPDLSVEKIEITKAD